MAINDNTVKWKISKVSGGTPEMVGATSTQNGQAGAVPAPGAGDTTKYLRGDGTWQVPTDTKYTHPSYTAKSSGLYKVAVDATGHVSETSAVTKSDITALGIPAQDTTYTLPNATSSTLGGVKVGSNISVSSGTISLTKDNVTSALGYTPPTSAGGITLSSNVTVTKSTQSALSASMTGGADQSTIKATIPNTVAGIAAGTYTIQNLLQNLVNKSHTHTNSSFSTTSTADSICSGNCCECD